MSLYSELRRRHVFKVAAAYAVVAWVLVQVANIISQPLSFAEWFETIVLTLLGLGFPIAVILAWAFDLSPAATPQAADSEGLQERRSTGFGAMISGAMVAIAFVAVAGIVYWYQGANERLARTEGVEQLRELIDASDFEAAYAQARRLEKLIPGDPALENERPKLAWASAIITEPAGARTYRRGYRQTDGE